ncbi:hypothetical protein ACLEPN_05645 [Myxococcus sp. 1LA]
MPHGSRLTLFAMFALLVCLNAGESQAQQAQSGVARHDAYVTVPNGTINDWGIHVSPNDMGFEEPGSEGDNALLKLECYAVQINQHTWRIVARYKARPWSNRDGTWSPGSANYLLVKR